jgi:hypothetical protein
MGDIWRKDLGEIQESTEMNLLRSWLVRLSGIFERAASVVVVAERPLAAGVSLPHRL